jgi:hypothetical protein
MAVYYVSTPRWTCKVACDMKGVITDTAPLLRRTWQGQPITAFFRAMRERYRRRARFWELDTEENP